MGSEREGRVHSDGGQHVGWGGSPLLSIVARVARLSLLSMWPCMHPIPGLLAASLA